MASYSVEIKPTAEKRIRAVGDRATRNRIIAKIRSLADDPRPPGAIKMTDTLRTHRIRQGDFRIIYEIEDDRLVVLVVTVANRRDAYRGS